MFCRSALLLSFCENRFCLSQLLKKLNSTERGALFRHFCVSKVITTAHAHQSGVIFHFFPRAFKQKKIKALRPKMTKIASRGGPALSQLQLRCSNLFTGPQASSHRGELSAKRAAKNVIGFCRADRNLFRVKAWRATFKARHANLNMLDDRRKREKKKKRTARSTCGRRSHPPPSIDRRSSQRRSLQVSFQNLSCLVSLTL